MSQKQNANSHNYLTSIYLKNRILRQVALMFHFTFYFLIICFQDILVKLILFSLSNRLKPQKKLFSLI